MRKLIEWAGAAIVIVGFLAAPPTIGYVLMAPTVLVEWYHWLAAIASVYCCYLVVKDHS